MTGLVRVNVDAKLDLVIEREIGVPVERVWEAWTNVEQLKKWFVPKPWSIKSCEIDVRPGGIFRTVMQPPPGESMPPESESEAGCYLEVVPQRRLSFTDALGPGFRPKASGFMTAIIEMEPRGKGTWYRAIALHKNPDDRAQHEAMGFHQGWGAALEQMIKMIRGEAF
jgi:uncharacterized protein YndB with AHSA1/START domain